MKKSIKILSLVLALALICGALVISSFAAVAKHDPEVAGVNVIAGMDFTDATVGFTSGGVSGPDDGSIGGTNGGKNDVVPFFKNVDRHGFGQVVQNPIDNNVYVTVEYKVEEETTSTSVPYFTHGHANAKKEDTIHNTYKYQVADFDVAFPTGKALNYFYTFFETRCNESKQATSPVGVKIWSTKQDEVLAQLVVGASNDPVGDTINLDVNGKWSHITLVVEMTDIYIDGSGNKVDDGTPAIDYTAYLAVNDVIISKVAIGNSYNLFGSVVSADDITSDLKYRDMFFAEFRLQWNAKGTANENAKVAFDNVTWRSIDPTAYANIDSLKAALATGKNGDLGTWTDSLYDAENMPYGTSSKAFVGTGADAVYYDDLKEAIEATPVNGTLTLLANSNVPVAVNKQITIIKNGFTGKFVGTQGSKMEENDESYTFTATSVFINVMLQPCACGKCVPAITAIQVYEGSKIWDAIAAHIGKEFACSYDDEIGNVYEFDTFTVMDSMGKVYPGNVFDKEVVVTAAMAGSAVKLTPTYKCENFIYVATFNADGTLYSKRTISQATGASFAYIVKSAPAGGTVRLYADFNDYYKAVKSHIEKDNITLDLNGYDIISRNPNTYTKPGSFLSTKKSFTLMSSVVGSDIFIVTQRKNAADGTPGAWTDCTPFVVANAAGATINVVGKDAEGNNTLTFYGGTFIQMYGYVANMNIDGGTYCRTGSGNNGLFQFNGLRNGSIKNATIYGKDFIFGFMGNKNNDAEPDVQGVMNIDNCALLGPVVAAYSCNLINVNVTNTYIEGTIDAAKKSSTYSATNLIPKGDEWTFGEGCYFADTAKISGTVTYAGKVVDINETKEYKLKLNDFSTGEITDFTKLTDTARNVNFVKYVGKAVNVNWIRNGETIATTEEVAGFAAQSPDLGTVEGTEGMVNYAAKVMIPADATDTIEVKVEEAETVYTPGKVDVQFSMSMVSNLKFNYFLPMVEGIEYRSLVHSVGGYDGEFKASAMKTDANGKNFAFFETYPGTQRIDQSAPIEITYTYNGQDITYKTVDFSALNYVESILNKDYAKSLKSTVAYLVEYANAVAINKGKTPSAAVNTLMNTDAFKAAVANTATAPADASNKATIEKMADAGYTFEIVPMTYADGATIAVKLTGTYGVKMYKADENGKPNYECKEWCVTTDDEGNTYIYMNQLRNYALDDELVIEVYEGYTADENNVVTEFNGLLDTFKWSLAGYMNDQALEGNQATLVNALYNYAVAGSSYIKWLEQNGYNVFE